MTKTIRETLKIDMIRILPLLLILSLLANAYFVFRAWQRNKSVKNIKPVNTSKEMADIFRALPNEPNEIIFAGTSITAQCPLPEYFPGVKNRGIGGNTSKNLLDRIDEIYESKPAKVFVEIGINDIASGVPLDTLVLYVNAVMDSIHSNSPSTEVFALSMAIGIPAHVNKVAEANKAIERICKAGKCTFIDAYQRMVTDKLLGEKFTTDGVHLSAAGYKEWVNALRPYVSTLRLTLPLK